MPYVIDQKLYPYEMYEIYRQDDTYKNRYRLWVGSTISEAAAQAMVEHLNNVETLRQLGVKAELGDRQNQGKLRFDLLPERAIRELVIVFTKGAAKYSPRNWEKGLSFMDTVASLRRHLNAWVEGEAFDQESGCHHMAHAAFNCLALVEFHFTGKGKDDRPYVNNEDDQRSAQSVVPVETGSGENV